ncbi:MAG: 30S ribosomal protein S8e [Candidatus Micrarchaeia archaeon]
MSNQLHSRSKTKSSGNGKRVLKFRDKRKSELGGFPADDKLSEKGDKDKVVHVKMRGGKLRLRLKKAAFVNLLTKDGYKKVRIKGVVDSKANRNYARLNIITKGTIISTELGNAIVINRPRQSGTVVAKVISG